MPRRAARSSAATALALVLGCVSAPAVAPVPPAPPAPPPPIELQVLAFNDFHGNLQPPTEGVVVQARKVNAGGAAYLAAHVKALRRENPNTLVVSAGDLVGATPFASSLFQDEPTVLAMNALGLDVAAVGNHEFDEGLEELQRLMNGGACHPKKGCRIHPAWTGARFAVLAANARRPRTQETVFPASIVKTVGGVKVGIIGLTLEGTARLQPEGFSGVTFDDEIATVNPLAAALDAEGVHTIVVLIHQGGTTKGVDVDGCEDLEGPIVKIVEGLHPAVDLVVSGHTHRFYDCVVAGKRTTSAGSYGRGLTRVVLFVDPTTGDVVKTEAQNRVVSHTLKADPEIEALLAPYLAEAAQLGDRVVGHISGDLLKKAWPKGGSALGSVLADAHLSQTRALGAEVAFMHPGGIRTDLLYAPAPPETAPGEVRLAEVGSVQPFENRLELFTITGGALAQLLTEQARRGGEGALSPSAEFRYTIEGDEEHATVQLSSLRLKGKAVRADQPIKVTVNAYLAGKGFSRVGKRIGDSMTDTEAFARYLESTGPVNVPAPRVGPQAP